MPSISESFFIIRIGCFSDHVKILMRVGLLELSYIILVALVGKEYSFRVAIESGVQHIQAGADRLAKFSKMQHNFALQVVHLVYQVLFLLLLFVFIVFNFLL